MAHDDGVRSSEPGRPWPVGRTIRDEDALRAQCPQCGTVWRTHRNLASYRFVCGECGAWVPVPQPTEPTPLQLQASRELVEGRAQAIAAKTDPALTPASQLPRDEAGLKRIELPEGTVYEGEISPNEAMAPGSMVFARDSVRARWTTRTTLEIAAMMAAIVGPHAVATLALTERQAAVAMPLWSLVGALGVVLVGMTARTYTFGGLRPVSLPVLCGSVAGGAALALAASGWVELIDRWTTIEFLDAPFIEAIGLPMTFVVIALLPAFVEELAFRGLLQGRITALSGRNSGILTTAALFALAHGVSLGTPFHITAGVLLGYLRDRTGSLYPGMVAHGVYNASIVLWMTARNGTFA